MPLSVKIGGDTSGFASAMAKAQAIAAVTSAEIARKFENSAEKSVASFARLGKVGGALALGGAAIAGFLAISKSLSDASEQMERFIKLGDDAKEAGVSAEFFQRFTKGAEELQTALEHAGTALAQKYGVENSSFAAASEIFIDLLKNVQSPAFAAFTQALNFGDQEASIRASVDMIRELFDLGRKLEGLKIAESIFGEQTANQLRAGSLDIEQIAKNIADTSTKDIISNESVARARELAERIDAAKAAIAEALATSITFAAVGEQIKGIWAGVLETIAAVATRLASAVNTLRQAENMRIQADLERSIEAEERVKMPGGATNMRLIRLRAELASRQGVVMGPLADEARYPSTTAPLPPKRPAIDTTEKEKKKKDDDKEALDQIERLISNLTKQNDLLRVEAENIGKSNTERQVATAQVRLEAAAREASRAATDAETEAVRRQGEERGRLLDKMEKHRQAIQLQQFAGNQLVDILDKTIINGEKLNDVMGDVAKAIARAALQAAILGSGPLAGLFGTTGSGGQTGGLVGLFANALKFQTGGIVPGSGPVPIIAHGGEAVIPKSVVQGGGLGGQIIFSPVTHINGTGGDIQALRVELDARDRRLMAAVPAVVRNAQRRNF